MSNLEKALTEIVQNNIDFLSKTTKLSKDDILESALRYSYQEIQHSLYSISQKVKQGKGQ